LTHLEVRFRIARNESDESYQRRYNAFYEAARLDNLGYWADPTSSFLVGTEETIDAFSRRIAAPLNPKTDMFWISGGNEVRYFGAVKDLNVFKSFHPHAREVVLSVDLSRLFEAAGLSGAHGPSLTPVRQLPRPPLPNALGGLGGLGGLMRPTLPNKR
jgi:hypothetical protein